MADTTPVETRLFIDNEFVAGKAGKTFQLVNPATEEQTHPVHEAGQEDIDHAVSVAQKAQKEWAALDSHKRSSALISFAQLLLIPENTQRLAYLDSICMGVTTGNYAMQTYIAALMLQHAAAVALDIVGETSLSNADSLGMVLKQPFGVTAAIIPWNSPVTMAASAIGGSLAAGNALIIKSSEKAPLSCLFLAQLIKISGVFPPGVVQIVSGLGPTTGAIIAEHMLIRKLSFVGSVATGKLVRCAAARSNLKDVTLELGGKSPVIVFEDANLQRAAVETAGSIALLSGQACVALSRVYVHESIVSKFLEAYNTAFQSILTNPGNPLDPTSAHAPQADILQYRSVLGFIDRAKASGLTPAIGGGPAVDGKGYFVQPTVFVNAPETHELVQKEIFGPVSVVQTFTDEADVLRRANDTEYGLFASVYTRDIARALRVTTQLEAGSVGINTPHPLGGIGMPFGGWKQSGEGRTHGRRGVDEWLEIKTVMINLKD